MGNINSPPSTNPVRDDFKTEFGCKLLPEEVPDCASGTVTRAKIALKTGTLDEAVISYLTESCDFFQADEGSLPGLGFRKCMDYPHLPYH